MKKNHVYQVYEKIKKCFANRKITSSVLSMLIAAVMLFSPLGWVIAEAPGNISRRVAGVSANDRHRIGDNEFRGVWIASVFNIDFPSRAGLSAAEQKAELDEIVRVTKEAGLNAIFFQVRPTADALYNSTVFPTSRWLTGTQGDPLADGFDPLAYIIEISHANNIELHAWINPYRVTTGSPANPQHDVNVLAPNHPARLNPDWVVPYADGRLYFNPGLPQVRDLIVRGILDIIENYNVDGIHFDDYFYPYPRPDAHFDDDAAFERYGRVGMSRGDWRRENVNILMREVHEAIQEVNPAIRFGVSPFGIWANRGNNAAGSETTGLQGRYAIYADVRAWVDGGWIDYVIPQIYWEFTFAPAPFDVLTRWWSTLLDGTDVDLYIGHAVYKLSNNFPYEFNNEVEIPRQIQYARQYISVRGSAFFGFRYLRRNTSNITENLARMFAEPKYIPRPVSTGASITVGMPQNDSTVATANANVRGGSDPAFPVYHSGQRMTRTRSGFFTTFVPLSVGRNELVFTQPANPNTANGRTIHVITRGERASGNQPVPYVFPQMQRFEIIQLSPAANVIYSESGGRITVRVQAPSGSTVTARLGDTTVELTPLTEPPNEGRYMTEVFSGTIELPEITPDGGMVDIGDLIFTANRGANEHATLTGSTVKLINEDGFAAIEVIRDFAHLRSAPGSSWVNDFTPASVGMRDTVTGFRDGYFRLSFGGYISTNDVRVIPERTLLTNRILSAAMEVHDDITEIRFGVTENVPVDARIENNSLNITLFNSPRGGRILNMPNNPLFTDVTITNNTTQRSVTYSFPLVHADNFYGFDVAYEGGFIIVRVRNPIRLVEGDRPLAGLTIAVDPGHGGRDPGSMGFLGIHGPNEKDLVLDVSLALRDLLTEMGAKVVMTRITDTTFDLAERVFYLNDLRPDLAISIHYDSMNDNQDNTRTRGITPLYTRQSGRLLANTVGRTLSEDLDRHLRAARHQNLGIARNHRFPVALIEIGFITNMAEFEFAMSDEGVQRTAQSLARGVVEFVNAQARFLD